MSTRTNKRHTSDATQHTLADSRSGARFDPSCGAKLASERCQPPSQTKMSVVNMIAVPGIGISCTDFVNDCESVLKSGESSMSTATLRVPSASAMSRLVDQATRAGLVVHATAVSTSNESSASFPEAFVFAVVRSDLGAPADGTKPLDGARYIAFADSRSAADADVGSRATILKTISSSPEHRAETQRLARQRYGVRFISAILGGSSDRPSPSPSASPNVCSDIILTADALKVATQSVLNLIDA